MRSERYTRVLIVAAIVLLALPVSAADGPERDRAVPTEAALWEAAGKAYTNGTDKSAAMQQYRLFVQSYKGSQKAAKAQFMLAECYFAVDDYERALSYVPVCCCDRASATTISPTSVLRSRRTTV